MRSCVQRAGGLCLVLLCSIVLRVNDASAQTTWTNADIGNPSAAGTGWSGGGYDSMMGSGTGLAGVSDQLALRYQQTTGDVDVKGCIEYAFGDDPAMAAGLMVRESLDPAAPAVLVSLSPASGVTLTWRAAAGTVALAAAPVAAPQSPCLRLVRRANTFTAYVSNRGSDWQIVGESTVTMAVATVTGMSLSSHDPATVAQSMFSGTEVGVPAPLPPIPPSTTPDPSSGTGAPPPPSGSVAPAQSLTPLPAPTPRADSLIPDPWATADLGTAVPNWSTDTYDGQLFTVTGSGQGVQGTADQAHIVYRAIDGDADVIVRVLGMWTTGSGESGLMLRPSLDANSPVAYIGTTNRNGFVFASRPLAGAAAARSATPDAVGTGWLRLSRQGDLFSSYWAPDKVSWVPVGSDLISMPSRVYVGMTVSSGSPAASATAMLSDLSIASATPVTTSPPPTTTPPPGTNQLPVVALTSPSLPATIEVGSSFMITATAADGDGWIAQVNFYADNVLVGSAFAAPFQITWAGSNVGSVRLTVEAVDNAGGRSASPAILMTMVAAGSSPAPSAPPPPSSDPPKPGLVISFAPSPDHDVSVTSYVVDLHTAGDAVTAPPIVSSDIGKPVPSDGVIVFNIFATIDQIPGGTYYVALRAVGPDGSSAAVASDPFTK